MELQTLRDLYAEQLQDIHNLETQLIDELPRMAEHASHPELRDAFQTHLEETRNQRQRVEQILDRLGVGPGNRTCHGMEGILKEGAEFIEEKVEDNVRDAALITAAQRAEHYEIAAYGTVRAYAELLDRHDEHEILSQTLEEEEKTDRILNEVAIKIVNPEAAAVT